MRNDDHAFEWTRKEFRTWAEGLAQAYGYTATFHGIGGGPLDEVVPYGEWRGGGPMTQAVVFESSGPWPRAAGVGAAAPAEAMELVWSSADE